MYSKTISIILLLVFFLSGFSLTYSRGKTGLQVFNFKRGDIIVKANHNWFPGTSQVEGGIGFGHAVIVLEGGQGKNIDSLLAKVRIFESHSRNVAPKNQLRENYGINPTTDPQMINLSFTAKYEGSRYRLRPNLNDQQIDSLITYIVGCDNGESSWRSIKRPQNNHSPKHFWYCSLLIYQAFHDVLHLDADVNGGVIVFPNDLINSKLFDGKDGRTRF